MCTESSNPVSPGFDVEHLRAEVYARADEILIGGLLANTHRTYRDALRAWCLWYRARFYESLPLPVPAPVARQFLLDFLVHRSDQSDHTAVWGYALPKHVDELLVQLGVKKRLGPWALNTVDTRLAALAAAHEWHGYDSPTEIPEVRRLWRTLRHQQLGTDNEYVRGFAPRRTKVVSLAEVHRMLDVCEASLMGIRDRALIAFAFSAGGRQRAEIAASTVESLKRGTDNQCRVKFKFTLRRAHVGESQSSESSFKPISGLAAQYLDAWLEASKVREGALWRRIQKGLVTTPLSSSAVFDIVSKRAIQAGLAGINPSSLRLGFVTTAAERQLPTFAVMAVSGHRSFRDAFRHYPIQTVLQPQLDPLLGETKPVRNSRG
jgi:integrase